MSIPLAGYEPRRGVHIHSKHSADMVGSAAPAARRARPPGGGRCRRARRPGPARGPPPSAARTPPPRARAPPPPPPPPATQPDQGFRDQNVIEHMFFICTLQLTWSGSGSSYSTTHRWRVSTNKYFSIICQGTPACSICCRCHENLRGGCRLWLAMWEG